MASHSLAIAKASLTAGFIRADPTSVPRDEISAFHASLDRALAQCSPANVETCTEWLVKHVRPSRSRTAVVAKYLVALAASLENKKPPQPKAACGRRQQLHILYVLHDFLHHCAHHDAEDHAEPAPAKDLAPFLKDLFAHAAAHKASTFPRHHAKLTALLDLWSPAALFPPDTLSALRSVVTAAGAHGRAADVLGQTAPTTSAPAAEAKKPAAESFVLPAYHGEPDAPYYEQPAATLLPHMTPGSGAPIDPQAVRALPLDARPAPAPLVRAVEALLRTADRIYDTVPDAEDEDEGVALDMDEMGQPLPKPGEEGDADTYYGWSRAFCERMQAKRHAGAGGPSRGRGRSRSDSGRSRSPGPRKRRRYSSADSSRSASRSRSRSRDRRRPKRYDSRSRSRSPPRRRPASYSRSRSRARSDSYSPPPAGLGADRSRGGVSHAPPPQPAQGPGPGRPLAMPFENGVPPLGPDGTPLPPPPPPHWQGPWPPPPPPLRPGAGPAFRTQGTQ